MQYVVLITVLIKCKSLCIISLFGSVRAGIHKQQTLSWLRNVNQQNTHLFQINALFQFMVSSTCFENHVFIIRKTICAGSLFMV